MAVAIATRRGASAPRGPVRPLPRRLRRPADGPRRPHPPLRDRRLRPRPEAAHPGRARHRPDPAQRLRRRRERSRSARSSRAGSATATPRSQSSLELGDVIRQTANLGANYPEIVAILQAAERQKNLPGPLVVDAVPGTSPDLRRRRRSSARTPPPRKTTPSRRPSSKTRRPKKPKLLERLPRPVRAAEVRRASSRRTRTSPGPVDLARHRPHPVPPNSAHPPHPPSLTPQSSHDSARSDGLVLVLLKVARRAVRKIVLTVRSATARRRAIDPLGGPGPGGPPLTGGGCPVTRSRGRGRHARARPRSSTAVRGRTLR